MISVLLAGTIAFAHDGMDHVRGVVKATSDYSVTVETDDKTSMVLSVTSQTTVRKSRKRVQLKDLKVDDRVFIEVPEGTTVAAEIEIEIPNKSAAPAPQSR